MSEWGLDLSRGHCKPPQGMPCYVSDGQPALAVDGTCPTCGRSEMLIVVEERVQHLGDERL